jgi:CHAT domain
MEKTKPEKDADIIDWLNRLIMLAQWDAKFPFQIASLFTDSEKYKQALDQIQTALTKPGVPSYPDFSPLLGKEEWEKLFGKVTAAPPLRELFVTDPFQGATPEELSTLAEVADVTTDPQTMVYSRNGTLLAVVEALRQSPLLDAEAKIWDGLNTFLTLLDSHKAIAEMLYTLACSREWHIVLASLRDGRDYVRGESSAATDTLNAWNSKLTAEIREILFKPTYLSRTPRKLIKLAWEERDLFEQARKAIPENNRPPAGAEERKQTATIMQSLLTAKFQPVLEGIEADLQLLAVVGTHFIEARKFAKLDGLVYSWPDVSRQAMRNYAGFGYVEDCLVNRKLPSDVDLDAKEARELFEICKNDASLIRFLRFRPYFSEINESDLGRYRSLAPVVVAMGPSPKALTAEPRKTEKVDIPSSSSQPAPVAQLTLRMDTSEKISDGATPTSYTLRLEGKNTPPDAFHVSFSIHNCLTDVLQTIDVKSEDSYQPVLKELFSRREGAERLVLRAGLLLQNTVLGDKGNQWLGHFLEQMQGQGRIVMRHGDISLHFLPWEWLPGPGAQDLLLSQPRYSMVRALFGDQKDVPNSPLKTPLQLLTVIPNPPSGVRTSLDTSARALEELASNDKLRYRALLRDHATVSSMVTVLKAFAPQVLHFEGYVGQVRSEQSFQVYFTPGESGKETIDINQFAEILSKSAVKLVVIGRNQASAVFGNPAPAIALKLLERGVPAVLLPIRSIDDTSATAFATSFYNFILQGKTLEEATYNARRQLASRGGDWTAWALFANPSVLDSFQLLPGVA